MQVCVSCYYGVSARAGTPTGSTSLLAMCTASGGGPLGQLRQVFSLACISSLLLGTCSTARQFTFMGTVGGKDQVGQVLDHVLCEACLELWQLQLWCCKLLACCLRGASGTDPAVCLAVQSDAPGVIRNQGQLLHLLHCVTQYSAGGSSSGAEKQRPCTTCMG